MQDRERAYKALQSERCEGCDAQLDYSNLRPEQQEIGVYACSYECPACDSSVSYEINTLPGEVHISARTEDGDRIRDVTKPDAALEEAGHPAEAQHNYSHSLKTKLDIVLNNLERLQEWENRIPTVFADKYGTTLQEVAVEQTEDTIINLQRDSEWDFLHTDIHNYLSSLYSFHDFVKTVEPILVTTAETDRQYKDYVTVSKPLLGIRHYAQHHHIPPLGIRENLTTANRPVDILIFFDEDVRSYPYEDGFDAWFDDVDEDRINVSEHAIRHYKAAAGVVESFVKAGLDELRDELHEMEQIKDEYPAYDDVYHPDAENSDDAN